MITPQTLVHNRRNEKCTRERSSRTLRPQYFENMEVNMHIQNIYRSSNGIIGYIFNFNKILKSINNIKYLIKKENIKVVFCTGSYIAPAASFLCMLLKIKYFGQEQNIHAGLGNKVSSYLPGLIFLYIHS